MANTLNLKYTVNIDQSATIWHIEGHNYKKFADCATQEIAEDIISFYLNSNPYLLDSKEFQLNG